MSSKDFNSTIGPFIGKTYKLMNLFVSDEINKQQLDITIEQWVVLKVVSESTTPIIQNDLAYLTNRNKASLTRLLNTLEKKELIARENFEGDSRKKQVVVTSKGTTVFHETKPVFLQAMLKLQEGISTSELEQFFETIIKIQKNIQLHSN